MKKLFLLMVGFILITSCQNGTKTGYVDTETLFKEYKGVKVQNEKFKKQQEAFTKKYDSMVKQWQAEVQKFQNDVKKMSPKKAQQMDQELYRKQQIIQQMQQQESAQLSSAMQAETDSIINKVYDFIDNYGKNNAYEYIFTKNKNGGIMFGQEKNDITKAILKELDADFDKTTKK